MRSLQFMKLMGVYRGSTAPIKDEDLYIMEPGTTLVDITDETRKETENRYSEWIAKKGAANAVRAIIEEARSTVTSGPLTRASIWREEISKFRQKYNSHRQACGTRLPITLGDFLRVSSTRRAPDGMTPSLYRNILVNPYPERRLADTFGLTVEDVQAMRTPPDDYLEWTFLARTISMYAKVSTEGAAECVELSLQLIEQLVDSTYSRTFSKTRIKGGGGTSYKFSMFNVDIEELAALARHLTAKSTDQLAVHKILRSLELIWHFPIPQADEEWLEVDPRMSVQTLLS